MPEKQLRKDEKEPSCFIQLIWLHEKAQAQHDLPSSDNLFCKMFQISHFLFNQDGMFVSTSNVRN